MSSYTPTSADVGRCLRATAVYRDNIGEADEQATESGGSPRTEQQDRQRRSEVR